ncbi:MAG: GNAT family N-acetyltransferase [Sphingomonadaceae bacterium]
MDRILPPTEDSRLASNQPETVKRVDPLSDPLWLRLVDRRKSDVFHSPAWMRALTETYGFEVRALVATDAAGEPQAGMPFAHVSDLLGERIVSLPFSDYCDPLVANKAEWNILIGTLVGEGLPITLRSLHSAEPLKDTRLTLTKRAKWHGLDLSPDLDDIWRALDGSARQAIRKAEREGVTVRVAETEEELRAFFDMHLGTRKRKYRLLAQPYLFFQKLWLHLLRNHAGALMTAVHGDEIIGGVMFLEWKDTLYYKFNTSLPTHLGYRPNDLVIWQGIQYGKARGHRYLDFGLSDWEQTELARYKSKYATEEKTISFLRHTPEGPISPYQEQFRRLLGELTGLLTDDSVPDSITERAGDALYRFFV